MDRKSLIQKYLEAETTAAEERLLAESFTTLPPRDEEEREAEALLKALAPVAPYPLPEAGEEFDRIVRDARKRTVRGWALGLSGAAAAVAAALLLTPRPAAPAPAQDSARESAGGPGEIALFTTMFLNQSHFASLMLDKLQCDLSRLGYTLNTHRVTAEDRASMALPGTFVRERSAAVVCVEMFDRRYDEMVCDLGLPVLFVDGPAKLAGEALPADQL